MTAINRAARLRQLAAATGPSISIVCPLDELAPGNQHDERMLAELRRAAVREVESRHFDHDVAEKLLQNLDQAHAMAGGSPSRGVALFAAADTAHVVPLRTSVKPRVTIGRKFAIAEVVADAMRTERARLLVLSLTLTRCIDLNGDNARERHDAGFPMATEAPTREETPHKDFALDEHEHSEAARFVLRIVDTAFEKVHEADPRPLVLLGAERDLSYWDEVSRSSARVIGRVHGNYEWAGTSEISALAVPALELHRSESDRAIAAEIREKLTNGAACGIADVWLAARAGRGHLLAVEEGYHFNGRLDGSLLEPAAASASDAFDAVDDTLCEQICHNGEVLVVGAGTLAELGCIGMILRY